MSSLKYKFKKFRWKYTSSDIRLSTKFENYEWYRHGTVHTYMQYPLLI